MKKELEARVRELIEQNYEEIRDIRRDLHQHPELSEHEERTMAKICSYLDEWGIPYTSGIGGHGVVGIVEGKAASAGRAVAIRADIDALPIQESVECEFKSVNDGVMHACGHDIHTAMLLGAGKVLKTLENEFSGAVKLFFQPAEETVGGAAQMIADGCMQNPDVSEIISFHVAPYLPTGTIEFCRGKMNAATCELIIDVEGVSCHGAHPEGGVDAIVAASQIVTALQSIISRNLSPANAGIITIGQFHAGTKNNIIAGNAHLSGTIRALDPDTMETLKNRIKITCENIAAAYGGSCIVTLHDGYPALINDDALTEKMNGLALELFGKDKVVYMPEPSLGADDFAYFTQRCPGVYMNIGTDSGQEAVEQKLHSEYYNPDEEAMKSGILMETIGVLELLDKED